MNLQQLLADRQHRIDNPKESDRTDPEKYRRDIKDIENYATDPIAAKRVNALIAAMKGMEWLRLTKRYC